MNGEGADVSAGKEERLDDEGVGCKSQASTLHVDDRLVVQAGQNRICKRGEKNGAHQVGAQAASAAVA
jgi:hypothetical protein